MKKSFVLALFLFAGKAFSSHAIALKLRSGYSDFAKTLQTANTLAGEELDLLADHSFEFPNGNTYVMLNDPQVNRSNISVKHKDVYLALPEEIDANVFMELLFKIYAAKKSHARTVTLVSLYPADEFHADSLDLPYEQLLATAGAARFCTDGVCVNLEKKSLDPIYADTHDFLITGDLHPDLAQKVSRKLAKSLCSFQELKEGLCESSNKNVFLFGTMSQPANLNFLKMLEQTHHLYSKKHAAVQLLTPYLPYARSDKQEEAFGVSAQGRLVADLIEAVGAQSLATVRPHVGQSLGFFTIATVDLKGREVINQYLRSLGVETIVSPDAGFQKDATKYADELGLPVLVLNKARSALGDSRIVTTGSLGELLDGKKVAIIDDETATGKTLTQAAEYLKQQGAVFVAAVVTHLAGPASALNGCTAIDTFALTDSLVLPQSLPTQAKVLSIADNFAEYISSF